MIPRLSQADGGAPLMAENDFAGDVAVVIVFLASRANRFMTGETMVANGGYLMV